MACPTPFDALRFATEYLPDILYRRASFKDLWLNLIPREEFKRGTGLIHSTFTVGRSEPTSDTEEWPQIELTSGDSYTGSCTSSYNETSVGFDERTYRPETFALKGPVICQDDLIFGHDVDAFWSAYLEQLRKRATRSYGNRFANIYDHFVPKNIANGGYDQVDGGTGAPPAAPVLTALPQATSELTQEMLDTTAVELNEEGASDANSGDWITLGDGPIYPLQIGQEASQNIVLNNSEFRKDFRWAEPNTLFRRLGAGTVIKNFRHVITLFPPRYTWTDGVYTRVPTWVMNDGTKGKVAEVNPDWKNADYEGARVLNPWVWHSEVVRPVNVAAGMTWPAKNYMGEWEFIVGGKEITDGECFDPRKKLGRHFAEFKHAPKPIFPNYGRLIIFKRCRPGSYSTQTCS